MPNVYFAGFFAVLIVLGLGGAYVKGGNDREARIVAAYQARDLKAASDYAAKEREITDAYRKKEAAWTSASAAVSQKYQRELANAHTSKLAALASIDAGTLRLRDPNATDSKACDGSTARITSAAPGHHGAEGTYLPAKTAAFLLGLAAEADSVVIQLTACQSVLASERQ